MLFLPKANLIRSTVQRLVLFQPNYSIRLASTAHKPISGGASSLVPPNILKGWYNVFGKSSAMYATWLVTLIVVGEYATGKLTDALWTMNNYGRTYDTVDWSKFDQFEDDEEEEEEEDEDDDE